MLTNGILGVQSVLVLALGVAALGLEVWALVEACRFGKGSYVAAGKQTKTLWVVVLAVAAVLGLVFVQSVLSFLSIAAVAAAAVFLVGIRPALRQVSGRGRSSGSGGPYGGW